MVKLVAHPNLLFSEDDKHLLQRYEQEKLIVVESILDCLEEKHRRIPPLVENTKLAKAKEALGITAYEVNDPKGSSKDDRYFFAIGRTVCNMLNEVWVDVIEERRPRGFQRFSRESRRFAQKETAVLSSVPPEGDLAKVIQTDFRVLTGKEEYTLKKHLLSPCIGDVILHSISDTYEQSGYAL